jgi:hypothetical protein
MEAAATIRAARAAAPQLPAPELLKSLAFVASSDSLANEGIADVNELLREQIARVLNKDLQPNDHALIRYILLQEMQAHQHVGEEMTENLRRCAYLLYRLGNVEDSILLWKAKNINFDTYCGLDIQFLVGAGLTETLAYLEGKPDIDDLVEYLLVCRDAGDFAHMEDYNRDIKLYFDE